MKGQHTHWENYYTRIIPQGLSTVIANGERTNQILPEKLQLICILDGVIFHEAVIKSETKE
jgi:hypothetical protein